MSGPLSLYVLVDALGWEVLRGRPFLDDVLVERRWLVTILGYSSGAIPSAFFSAAYPPRSFQPSSVRASGSPKWVLSTRVSPSGLAMSSQPCVSTSLPASTSSNAFAT